MTKQALITGLVQYREGDGTNITIRPGPCMVDETALDATISWTDGDARGVAAMPLTDFRRLLARRVIHFLDPQAA
ncbi:MAG: hypothetical protein QE285_20380 [Aquabacterium sp.]|nr:hypothetical protein [Aquabacterium sp.]